jgi:2-phosphosulfolactate phosphatase
MTYQDDFTIVVPATSHPGDVHVALPKIIGSKAMMQFQQVTLETCGDVAGTVVVIDVLRAFSTAAYAFSAGVSGISLVSSVDDAFALKQRFPEALLMGEEKGLPIDGFDYGNSPIPFMTETLSGRQMIQRTSAGTQGVVGSKKAEVLLASSLCCARATVQHIKSIAPKVVTFVITGYRSADHGEEDRACADYIESLLKGERMDQRELAKRVRESAAAGKFLDPNEKEFPLSDLEYSMAIDKFCFAMVVERQGNQLLMRSVPQ